MLYGSLLKASGLSQREAAAFHGVRPDTVKSWSAGRNPAPSGAIDELATLIDRMVCAAEEAIDQIEKQASEHGMPEVLELGIAVDDAEAQSLGWPAVTVHRVVLGLIAGQARANGIKVQIVPRGSTVATAAAIDQVEKDS